MRPVYCDFLAGVLAVLGSGWPVSKGSRSHYLRAPVLGFVPRRCQLWATSPRALVRRSDKDQRRKTKYANHWRVSEWRPNLVFAVRPQRSLRLGVLCVPSPGGTYSTNDKERTLPG